MEFNEGFPLSFNPALLQALPKMKPSAKIRELFFLLPFK
jgi:hypothetical protein